MKRHILTLLFVMSLPASAPGVEVLAAGPVRVRAQAPAAEPADTTERLCVARSARFGFQQIILANEAARRSRQAEVLALARSLSSTWAEETWSVRGIGRKAGWEPPKRVAPEQRQDSEALARTPDEAFDQAYLALVVREHEAFLGVLDARARKYDDPALRSWVQRMRPIVKSHFSQARDLAKRLTPPAG